MLKGIARAVRGITRRLRTAAADPIAPLQDPLHRGQACGAATPRSPGSRGERWVILAVVPLDDSGGGQRSAQLARALAREGSQVTYVARFPRQESVDLAPRREPPTLSTMPWDPAAILAWLATLDERVRLLVELPERDVVALAEQASRLGARVIYDKIDDWSACRWAEWYAPEHECQLVACAHDLVASARALARQLASHRRPVHLVPNAVDRRVFAPAAADARPPADLARGEVTLLYAGSLWGDWFDWSLVSDVAEARPRWAINLVGDRPKTVPRALPTNVHFLGLKPQTALPAYYVHAGACLIPFVPSPVVDAVNPLKVYEYLAMHRPVVATPMPELEGLPDVHTAGDASETIAAVERVVTSLRPVAAVEQFLARNTWESRAASLAALVARPTISVIVLCFNNEDVIGKCVSSLLRYRGELGYRVVVVDNGSRDGSLEILERHASRGEIGLLRNSRNGCSSGRNLALARTSSEILVFLDSDQWVLGEGWLDPALRVLEEHCEVGAVGWNGGWFRPGEGEGPIVDSFPERAMGGRWAGEPFRSDVAYLATSGLVVPRSVLARTEGFDESYDPTCFEDTDLSFQIKAAGYELAYCPRIRVAHRPHRTTAPLAGYQELYKRNERYFLAKWWHHPDFFLGVPEEMR